MNRRPPCAANASPLLEGRGICKSFGGLAALAGVDVAVYPGDVVGLIGPNGSGKTTLFNCLTRLDGLDAGRIHFKGVDVTDHQPFQVARMGMSRTFQNIRVYGKLTVIENMLLSRQWRGARWPGLLRPSRPEVTERADDLLEFVTLVEQRVDLAGSLSWGQQRLLEIGMALMSDPDLILLDEATSGVNPLLVDAIRDRIMTLNTTHGKTIVLIEHNIALVADLCSRVVVLDHGEKLADGEVGAVLDDPAVSEAYFGRRGLNG